MANQENQSIIAEVVALLQGARFTRLATLDADTGRPFISLLAVALSNTNRPLTLISSLARHTRNLEANANGSLLYEEPVPGDNRLLACPRVTVSGTLAKHDNSEARDRFMAIHEDAQLYADFSDFSLWQMEIEDAYLVAGFGRIHTISGSDLLT